MIETQQPIILHGDMDRKVFDWCHQRRIPAVFVMAGGYGVEIESTLQVQMNTYRIALEYWQRFKALTETAGL